MTAKAYKRTLVTSALPYANGPLHLGHMAGVYVPSDIYVRYLRQRDRDVIKSAYAGKNPKWPRCRICCFMR